MPKVKAFWRGREIFQIGEFRAGWARISFWDSDSYFTGTGGCWADMDDITLEVEA